MANMYQVPTQILASQAKKTAELHRNDSPENHALLDGIGITGEVFAQADELGTKIMELEDSQEGVKADAATDKMEAAEAVAAVAAWRTKKVLPRARIALTGDKRLRHFRSGRLRSTRAATVIREGKLLVGAIRRFASDPEMVRRGLNEAMAVEGDKLIAGAEAEDLEAATAHMTQLDVSEELYELEDKLDDILSDIERCARAVFEPESAALKRYRMNEIRNYIAVMHDKGGDDSATVEAPDPDPTAPSAL